MFQSRLEVVHLALVGELHKAATVITVNPKGMPASLGVLQKVDLQNEFPLSENPINKSITDDHVKQVIFHLLKDYILTHIQCH